MRLAVILSLISFVVCAQHNDSVWMRISALSNDTEQVNRLYQQGYKLRNQDPAMAWKFAHRAEQVALKNGSSKHIAKSYNLSGILYYKTGDYKKALQYHLKALDLRESIHDAEGIALSQTNLGNIYSELGLMAKARQAYLQALQAFKNLGDEKRLASCLVNLGVVDQVEKKNLAASENYRSAFKLAEKLNDYELRSLCLNNIAQLYFEQGDYERSIAYNYDALEIRQMMDNEVEAADSYLNLAGNFIKLKRFDEAGKMLDTAYTLSRKHEYEGGLQAAKKVYADYFAALEDYKSAYVWLSAFQNSSDSLASAAEAEVPLTNNPGEVPSDSITGKSSLNNLMLLYSVLAMAVIIPYFLIRFKR